MFILWQVVYLLLWLFRLLLLARIVMEVVRSLAREWRPAGRSAVAMELLYTSTDPPVKLLRRMLPTMRLGGVMFDLSILILLVLIFILMVIVNNLIISAAA